MFYSAGICTLFLSALANAQYQMVKEYIGDNFFDNWNFYNNIDDLTHGDVFYAGFQLASQAKLAFVNDAGNAIMKVDNSSTVTFGNKRNSIRIVSQDQYTVGSLWIVDMLHVPYGCSVWPAWWTSATDWPSGGEIDIFEGVNQMTMNQMSLHTAPGCVHSNTSLQTSTLINSTDCSATANDNSGCTTTDPSLASYGAGFAADGGGMFVTEFATDGISIWFFNRSSIPDSLQGNASTVDTSKLGTPVANWASEGCDITEFFDPQQLIFDITLCGDYAGNTAVFQETCTGVCYDDFVVGPDPSIYDNAYFEVKSVRAYGLPGELTVISSSGAHRSAEIGGMFTLLACAIIGYISAL